MLNYIVGSSFTLAVILAICGLVYIIKLRKSKTAKKTAYKYSVEQKIESLIEAIKGLARNNGQSNASYITSLDTYNVDTETFKQLKVNSFADSQKVSDKQATKLSKIKA